MKQFFTLLSLLIVMGMSANVMAQSTGSNPYPGATHNYSVSSSATSWVWKVYKGSMATEVTTFPGSGIEAFTASGNNVDITWATDAAPGDEYIVVVEETDDAGCMNSKGLPVIITPSTFDLIVTNGGDACYANSVVVGWTGGQAAASVTYDHGEAEITYTIAADGVGASETWSFKPNFSYSPTGTFSETFTVAGSVSGPILESGGVYTLEGAETATITVTVDNGNSYDNDSAADAQDFTATLSLSDVKSGTGAVERTDTDNNEDSLDVSRPNTSQISTDN